MMHVKFRVVEVLLTFGRLNIIDKSIQNHNLVPNVSNFMKLKLSVYDIRVVIIYIQFCYDDRGV